MKKKLFVLVLLLGIFAQQALAYSVFRNAAVTTAVTIQGKLTTLRGFYILNTNASVCSVDLFNAVSGSVTLGTTVPQMSLVIPASQSIELSDMVVSFPSALSVAAVTAAGGGTTCTTGLVVNIWYT